MAAATDLRYRALASDCALRRAAESESFRFVDLLVRLALVLIIMQMITSERVSVI